MEDILNKLIDLVQKTVPALWEIARRQVFAQNISDLVIALIFIALAIFLISVQAKFYYKYDENKNDFFKFDDVEQCYSYKIGFWIISLILLIVPIANITTIIMKLYNPDYYAIQILIGLVK